MVYGCQRVLKRLGSVKDGPRWSSVVQISEVLNVVLNWSDPAFLLEVMGYLYCKVRANLFQIQAVFLLQRLHSFKDAPRWSRGVLGAQRWSKVGQGGPSCSYMVKGGQGWSKNQK